MPILTTGFILFSRLGAVLSGTIAIGLIILITKVGATGNLIGPSLKLWSPELPARLVGSASGWSEGTPILIILEIDPSSLETWVVLVLIPRSGENTGSYLSASI